MKQANLPVIDEQPSIDNDTFMEESKGGAMGKELPTPGMNLTGNISMIAPLETGGNESVLDYFDVSPKASNQVKSSGQKPTG